MDYFDDPEENEEFLIISSSSALIASFWCRRGLHYDAFFLEVIRVWDSFCHLFVSTLCFGILV